MKRLIKSIMLLLIACSTCFAQSKKADKNNDASFYTGIYPNYFKQAGYSTAAIDAKVDSGYFDLFKGPHKVYFEVGD